VFEPLGHLPQQPIAGIVAERVVDVLEAVDIDEQQRQARAFAPRVRERMLERLIEHRAIG
jgi:hypothetical protein